MSNKLDITINQFATFHLPVSLADSASAPLNIANWSFTASIKETPDINAIPVCFFNINSLDVSTATMDIVLHDSQSAVLIKRRYYWDLIGRDGGLAPVETVRLIEGKVHVNSGVTEVE
jgi:hypothetical protein